VMSDGQSNMFACRSLPITYRSSRHFFVFFKTKP